MKKISYLLIIILSLFIYTNVYAESISIKSIELISKDEDVEILSDTTSDNLTLNINLRFYNTGDFVKYKIIVENNTDEDYVLSNKNIYDENKLVKYEFIFDKNDDVLKAKSKKEFYLNVVYEKEITNKLLNNESNYSTSNTIELSLVKKQLPVIEEIKEVVKEMIVENPNTTDKILITVIAIIIAITITYILKRYKKTRYLILIGILSIPFISRAINKITIEINENIEIVKTRMAYNCQSASYNANTLCIDWNDYVSYDTYEKDTAYLFTTNTRKLPDSYKYDGITYNLDNTYDISDLQNEQVMLGVYYDNDGVALLLIGQDNDINAPIDLSFMFIGLEDNYSSILGKAKAIDLEYFDTSDTNNFVGMFESDVALVDVNISKLNTSNATTIQGMFWNCISLISLDVSNFDTSKVEDFSYIFATKNATMALEEIKGLENFDTSNGKNFNSIFQDCANLTHIDVSKWDTSKAVNLSYIFYNCMKLEEVDVSHFDTSNATELQYMFYKCKELKELDVSKWDTSKVTNMSYLFAGCLGLEELDLRNFDTSKVTNMNFMFGSNPTGYWSSMNLKRILGVEDFDTSNVESMKGVFFGNIYATSIDLTSWDTSKVTTMRSIFTRCEGLKELKINTWDVSKVTDFYDAIRATALEELDLSNWHPDSMEISNRMFNSNHELRRLDVSNFDFTIVPDEWDNYAYTFNGPYPDIVVTVKNQANKDWILSHTYSVKEENIIILN